jgi:hypothetical protein
VPAALATRAASPSLLAPVLLLVLVALALPPLELLALLALVLLVLLVLVAWSAALAGVGQGQPPRQQAAPQTPRRCKISRARRTCSIRSGVCFWYTWIYIY